MSQWEFIVSHTIFGHQQPARASFVNAIVCGSSLDVVSSQQWHRLYRLRAKVTGRT